MEFFLFILAAAVSAVKTKLNGAHKDKSEVKDARSSSPIALCALLQPVDILPRKTF